MDYVSSGGTKASRQGGSGAFFGHFLLQFFFFCCSSSRSEVSSRKRAVESKYICIQLISIGALPVQPQVLTDYRLPKKQKKKNDRKPLRPHRSGLANVEKSSVASGSFAVAAVGGGGGASARVQLQVGGRVGRGGGGRGGGAEATTHDRLDPGSGDVCW